MRRTRFVATGSYVPEKILTNDDLSKIVDTSDEWIQARTGIRQRHILGDDQTTSDMVVEAGRRALDAAGMQASELDLIVVATVTADMPMPSCAVIAQHKLGASCPAFDLGAACAGFSYGISVVDALVRSGAYRKVLFVGAEALSRYLDWEDRGTCILFGDGAGAVVAVPDEQPDDAEAPRGILATRIAADGSLAPSLNILGGGTQHPPCEASIADNLHVLRMDGRAVFTHAVRHMSEACEAVLAEAGVASGDVEVVLPHQANLRIIDAIVRRLSLERDRVLVNLDRFGNTSAASIPIALDEAVRSGRVREGTTLLTCGMGAGLTWGAALLRW